MDLGGLLGRRGGLLLSCRKLEGSPVCGGLVVSVVCFRCIFGIALIWKSNVIRAMGFLSQAAGMSAHKDLISELILVCFVDQGCFMRFNAFQ